MASRAPSTPSAAPAVDGDDCAELLRGAGMKVTRARTRALLALRRAAAPASHGEVEAVMAGDGDAEGIDRVTLYRVLDSLVAGGLALKAVDPRGVFRFTLADSARRHAGHVHFRCIDCGGVFCLDAAPPPPPRLPRGFRLAQMEVDVRGTCAQCGVKGHA